MVTADVSSVASESHHDHKIIRVVVMRLHGLMASTLSV